MNKTSIILITYNNLKFSKICIESIHNFTKKGTYEIIAVDNNSYDGTKEWLKKQSDLKVILNGDNKGFPAGCNQGIRAAEDGNDILLLNNDTIVTPSWLDNLRMCLYSDDSIGAAGAVTNSCSNLQSIKTNYVDFRQLIEFAKKQNQLNPLLWEERVRLIGFCMLIKNEVVKKIGGLDELYTPGNFEDDDYSLRIRKAGYRIILCGDCFIHHFGSASFGKQNDKFMKLLNTNSEKFAKKWGVNPSLLSTDERFILEPELKKIKAPDSILVAGGAFGAVPLYLKRRYPVSEISCYETIPLCAEILSASFNVSNNLDDFKKRKFDLIIILTQNRNGDFVNQINNFKDSGATLIVIGEEKVLQKVSQVCKFGDSCKRLAAGMLVVTKRNGGITVNKISQKSFFQMNFDISGDLNLRKISFVLRRAENGIDAENNINRVYGLLKSGLIGLESFENLVRKEIVKKDKVINDIGTLFYNDGRKKEALDLFIEAYKYNKQNYDLVYNLAYSLAEEGKCKKALEIINDFKNPDDGMKDLSAAISNMV